MTLPKIGLFLAAVVAAAAVIVFALYVRPSGVSETKATPVAEESVQRSETSGTLASTGLGATETADPASREAVLADLLALAGSDVDAAIAKAKTLYSGAELRLTLVFVAGEVVARDWSKLKAFYSHLSDPIDRDSIASQVAQRAVAKDAEAFVKFAREQEYASVRDRLLAHTVSALVSAKRLSEAAALAESFPTSQTRANALHWVAEGMVRTNPEEAIAWANSLASTEERRRAATTFVAHFVRNKDLAGIQAVASAVDDPFVQASCERQAELLGGTIVPRQPARSR